jgi:prepilin-type processing-associated H-X9-DG protein
MNLSGTNPNRLNARHDKRTKTNLLFSDGHAETVLNKAMPTAFDVTTLKLPQNAWPRWRLDAP